MSAENLLSIYNPSNLELINQIKYNTESELEYAIATAKNLFKHKKNWLPLYKRIEILKNLSILLSEQQQDFADLIALEGGKPLKDAKIEAERAILGIEIAIESLMQVSSGQQVPMERSAATAGRLAFTYKEPIGLVVAISAFNHPLNLIVHQVIPAVAMGCPVIIKPASTTPSCCIKFCNLVMQAGLPEGWCQPLILPTQLATKLVCDPRVDFFSFIGSSAVGWKLHSQLAPGVRCALEHGGIAPVILDHDINLNNVTPGLLKGGFYHAGQVCVSVQRIFANENIVSDLIKQLKNGCEQLITGNATSINTDVGPLILPAEVDRVYNWVNSAKKSGAEVICGGDKISATHYAPTVLLNPAASSEVSRQEIFGPVVCIYPYKQVEEAIKLANNVDYSFQAAVFSNNIDFCFNTAQNLSASAVMLNDHTAFRADWMPFAGYKSSGLGVGGIPYTMQDLVQEKLLIIKNR